MMFQILNLPGVLFYYIIMAACILPEIHGIRVVFGLPLQFMDGGMDAVVFGKWLLVAEVPILVNGMVLERGSQIELFSRIRLKKTNRFRIKLLVSCVIFGSIWVAVLAAGVMWLIDVKTALSLIPVAISSVFMWEAMQVMIYFCFKKAFWSGAAVLLVNGGSCLVGLHMKSVFQYMPAAWGMLSRSSLWLKPAYMPISYIYMIAANVGVAVICIIIAIKKEGDEPYGCNSY